MFFEFGKADASIKAAKKLAFDTGIPYYIFGSNDKNNPGYIVDSKLPPGCEVWTRMWPDGKGDSYMNPREKWPEKKSKPKR